MVSAGGSWGDAQVRRLIRALRGRPQTSEPRAVKEPVASFDDSLMTFALGLATAPTVPVVQFDETADVFFSDVTSHQLPLPTTQADLLQAFATVLKRFVLEFDDQDMVVLSSSLTELVRGIASAVEVRVFRSRLG